MKKLKQVLTSVPMIVFYVGFATLLGNVVWLPDNPLTIGFSCFSGLLMSTPLVIWTRDSGKPSYDRDTEIFKSVFPKLN